MTTSNSKDLFKPGRLVRLIKCPGNAHLKEYYKYTYKLDKEGIANTWNVKNIKNGASQNWYQSRLYVVEVTDRIKDRMKELKES